MRLSVLHLLFFFLLFTLSLLYHLFNFLPRPTESSGLRWFSDHSLESSFVHFSRFSEMWRSSYSKPNIRALSQVYQRQAVTELLLQSSSSSFVCSHCWSPQQIIHLHLTLMSLHVLYLPHILLCHSRLNHNITKSFLSAPSHRFLQDYKHTVQFFLA